MILLYDGANIVRGGEKSTVREGESTVRLGGDRRKVREDNINSAAPKSY